MRAERSVGLVTAVALIMLGASVAQAQSALSGLVDGASDLLRPEQAFPLSVERIAPGRVVATWDVRDGYYLYRDKITFRVTGEGNSVVRTERPPGEQLDDPNFGAVAVYREPVSMSIYLKHSGPVKLAADYQGCADAGVCYPPESVEVSLVGNGSQSGGATVGGAAILGGSALADALTAGRVLPVLTGFFLAGLLLAFTACLYPMVPILSGLIAGDRRRTSGRAFLLSLIYVEATAVTYALAGVAAGLSGAAIQADLQGPWVIGGFAALLGFMALGMFGLYELRLPVVWQTRIDALSRRQRGDTLVGVAVMGVLSALIVGACSGPALIAALAFISATGNAWLGGLALFVLANGMGVPLLVIGTAAGQWLPRTGPWMRIVRAVVGVLFLGVAIYLLDRILPAPLTLALWGVLLLGCGVFAGGLDRLGAGVTGGYRLRKAAGLAMVIWGVVALVGASAGGRNVWQPLSALTVAGAGVGSAEVVAGEFRTVSSLAGLRSALDKAQAMEQPALVDVYADWCVYCVQLDEQTFADAAVRQRLAEVVLLRLDVTEMSAADKHTLRALDVFLPPAVMFYGPDGRERREHRVVGFLGPEAFLGRLDAAWPQRVAARAVKG